MFHLKTLQRYDKWFNHYPINRNSCQSGRKDFKVKRANGERRRAMSYLDRKHLTVVHKKQVDETTVMRSMTEEMMALFQKFSSLLMEYDDERYKEYFEKECMIYQEYGRVYSKLFKDIHTTIKLEDFQELAKQKRWQK